MIVLYLGLRELIEELTANNFPSGNVHLTLKRQFLVFVLLHQGAPTCLNCSRSRCYLQQNTEKNLFKLPLNSCQIVELIAR